MNGMQLLTTDLLADPNDTQNAKFKKTIPMFKIAYHAVMSIQKEARLRSHEDSVYTYTVAGRTPFTCKLTCSQCNAETAQGTQCKRTVCVGIPVCAQHATKFFQIAIGRTKLADEQNKRLHFAGLFACSSDGKRRVVFKEGDYIVPYLGEVVTKAQVDARYDYGRGHGRVKAVAPYVMEQNTGPAQSTLFDAACYRSYGAFVNSASNEDAYAKHLVNGDKVTPNCVFEYHHAIEPGEKGHRDNERFPALTATRDIVHGEEILVFGKSRNTRKRAKLGSDVYPICDSTKVAQKLSGYNLLDDACDF
jgi:hypothetical protein